MTNAAHQQTSTVVPFRSRAQSRLDELPGIEGFYILTPEGTLGRYEADGRFHEEPELSEALATQLGMLLQQYRSGESGEPFLGLVTPNTPDRPWRSASLVFTNRALHEVYRTSNDPDAPLTAFQKRNKVKSVYRGMELVLDTKKASQPQHPKFCPVLFTPEVSSEVLCRRYGVATVDRRKVLEVLDLMVPFTPEEQRQSVLSGMVIEMLRARISPEMRRSSGLMLVEDAGTQAHKLNDKQANDMNDLHYNPWQNEPEEHNTCFTDGDPVTYWLLAWFAPFNELNDLQRQFIARGHTVAKKHAGTTLIERGSREDVSIYLIEGTLELEAFDGKTTTIVGGTRRAHLPVSQLRPHAYTVTAATDVTVIMVSQDMVREITRITTTYRTRPGIAVSEEEVLPESIAAYVAYEPEAQQS